MNLNKKEIIAMDCKFDFINDMLYLKKISIVDTDGDVILDTFVKTSVTPFHGFEDEENQANIEDENEDYMLSNDVQPFLIELFHNKIILVNQPKIKFQYLGMPDENTLDVGNFFIVDVNGTKTSDDQQIEYRKRFKSLIHIDDTLQNAKLFMKFLKICHGTWE